MALDSTTNFDITGPGGRSSAPGGRLDSSQGDPFGGAPDPKGGQGSSRSESVGGVSKPEDADVVRSVLYEDIKGSPGTLEGTLDDVFQISFNK